jgi:hypothetical protein
MDTVTIDRNIANKSTSTISNEGGIDVVDPRRQEAGSGVAG